MEKFTLHNRHTGKKYFSQLSERIFFLVGIVMLASEIWKQLTLTFIIGNGMYNWWYFPFQLCSIPMYLLLAYPWVQGRTGRRTLLAFFMSYCLLSGIAVFADTSGLQYPLPALTVHSYLWHILLILIGISAGILFLKDLAASREKNLFSRRPLPAFRLRPFFFATVLYLICCLIAEVCNLTFDRFGLINMFYINPDYKMQQVFFRDLLPVIGNIPAILVYLTATICGAFLLFLLWNLILRIAVRR